MGPLVRSIPIATSTARSGESCIVSGWGVKHWGDTQLTDDLQHNRISILEKDKCNEFYKEKLTDGTLCVGESNKFYDSCQVKHT